VNVAAVERRLGQWQHARQWRGCATACETLAAAARASLTRPPAPTPIARRRSTPSRACHTASTAVQRAKRSLSAAWLPRPQKVRGAAPRHAGAESPCSGRARGSSAAAAANGDSARVVCACLPQKQQPSARAGSGPPTRCRHAGMHTLGLQAGSVLTQAVPSCTQLHTHTHTQNPSGSTLRALARSSRRRSWWTTQAAGRAALGESRCVRWAPAASWSAAGMAWCARCAWRRSPCQRLTVLPRMTSVSHHPQVHHVCGRGLCQRGVWRRQHAGTGGEACGGQASHAQGLGPRWAGPCRRAERHAARAGRHGLSPPRCARRGAWPLSWRRVWLGHVADRCVQLCLFRRQRACVHALEARQDACCKRSGVDKTHRVPRIATTVPRQATCPWRLAMAGTCLPTATRQA
jgi:hypothetical protein